MSDTEKEVWEGRVDRKIRLLADVGDSRSERSRIRKVMAGKMLGGCWARNLGYVSG